MLTAAMFFGVMGGVMYVLAGVAVAVLGVPVGDSWSAVAWASPPGWLTILMIIGLAGIIGGGAGRWNPTGAGILLWVASVSSVAIGAASMHQALTVVADSPLSLSGWQWLVVAALAVYFIGALFALMLGGTLALLAKKKTPDASHTPQVGRVM